ncbi:MAG: hypothetical protein IPM54_05540 [Polyangiaceae bacterium]|nr:hypothetical protein [Polyangiaceae bacterium]
MQSSSLKKYRPHLEAVLGAISAEDDVSIRAILDEVDEILIGVARYFGYERAGWGGTGLDLTWMESGQMAIRSHVGTCLQTGCVDFRLELRPSWYFGERSSALSWFVEASVAADCSHTDDHSHMHTVHEVSVHATSAVDASTALRSAAQELKRLATDFPIEHWLSLASDENGETLTSA